MRKLNCIFRLAIIMPLFCTLCLSNISCGGDDEDKNEGYMSIEDVEGTYIVTISCQEQNRVPVLTEATGNITIKKQGEGIFSLNIICDEYGLNLRFEGINIDYEWDSSRLLVSNARNIDWDSSEKLPIWYRFSFNITSKKEISSGGILIGYHYKSPDDYYHFESGHKISQ